MTNGQVSVWVPIVVGLIGVAGVIAGQLVNTWREHRNERIRWTREQQRDARQDRLAWRDKRLAVALDLLITMNTWRELAVESWPDQVSDELRDTVARMSDRLAEMKLVGTERMRTAATEAVDEYLERLVGRPLLGRGVLEQVAHPFGPVPD
ncbi:hypothetical protein ACFQ1S_17320 [Kibdelosporangium lantanae]|uniref:Uncharacterized protein n=1 Tax=Kibdelosporangium lantanae TaxID=1497396 RepID=A0ABW3M9C0_9PSEU